MTIKERKKNHRALWLWLAKTGSEYKNNWPGWEKIEHQDYVCFLCNKYHANRNFKEDTCKCPIKWSKIKDSRTPCCNYDSPFYQWEDEQDITKRRKLALKIAGMWK